MNKKLILRTVYVCSILILVLVILYSGLQILESTVFLKDQNQGQTGSKTIIRNGVKYYPRQDVTVILLMGVNQHGKVVPTEFNHGGAVDMIALLVFDEKTKDFTVLNLNRDMMVDMPMLSSNGKEAGTYFGQLAYSHTYGDGMKVSCENVRKTVSNLLYGIDVDHYFSINMDAIAALNDAVGGVKVTVVDDFSKLDPTLTKGEIVLNGQQAVNFVQARGNIGDELNLSRMERHKEYMRNFAPALKDCMQDKTDFVLELYDSVADYVVTDCTLQALGRLETDYGDYSMGDVISLEGKNVLGETYYEFYADEDALDELILRLFYAPK